MNKYIIIKTTMKDYDRLVLCLTFESFLSYVSKLEDSLGQDSKEERVLIDQLLLTGNGQNRFMSLKFVHGKLDFKSAKIVSPCEYYRQETVNWLHNNYVYIENSILTDEQRQKIKENIIF